MKCESTSICDCEIRAFAAPEWTKLILCTREGSGSDLRPRLLSPSWLTAEHGTVLRTQGRHHAAACGGGLGCRLSPYSGSSVCDIRKDTESCIVCKCRGGQCMHISERYLRYLRTGGCKALCVVNVDWVTECNKTIQNHSHWGAWWH